MKPLPTSTIRGLVFSFALLLSVQLLGGAEHVDAAEIIRIDEQRVESVLRKDSGAVAELLSDQLVYGHADGRVQDKREFIAALTANRAVYRLVRYGSREVRPLGPSRVLTGTATFEIESPTAPVEFTVHYLAIYVFEDARWKLGAYHSAQEPDRR